MINPPCPDWLDTTQGKAGAAVAPAGDTRVRGTAAAVARFYFAIFVDLTAALVMALAMRGVVRGGFPTAIALGPLFVAQHSPWSCRRDAERTSAASKGFQIPTTGDAAWRSVPTLGRTPILSSHHGTHPSR